MAAWLSIEHCSAEGPALYNPPSPDAFTPEYNAGIIVGLAKWGKLTSFRRLVSLVRFAN